MRVVLDDLYVAALTLPGGRADICSGSRRNGRYVALLSEPILGETLGALGRRFSRDREELARAALFLRELTEHVSPRSQLRASGRADYRAPNARRRRRRIDRHGNKAMLRLADSRASNSSSTRLPEPALNLSISHATSNALRRDRPPRTRSLPIEMAEMGLFSASKPQDQDDPGSNVCR